MTQLENRQNKDRDFADGKETHECICNIISFYKKTNYNGISLNTYFLNSKRKKLVTAPNASKKVRSWTTIYLDTVEIQIE